MHKIVGRLIVVLTVLLASDLWAARVYRIADLGAIYPEALTERGVVVGWEDAAQGLQAVRVRRPRRVDRLGFLPEGNFSLATAIAEGRIVGYSGTGPGSQFVHAFIFSEEGLRDLGGLGGPDLLSVATGINQAGTITGYAERPSPTGQGLERRAVVWPAGGEPLDLGTLGGAEALAYAVNELGAVCGQSLTSNDVWLATLWPVEGDPTLLDTAGSVFSVCMGLNNAQEAVGLQALPGDVGRGFVHRRTTGFVTLPPLQGDTRSEAMAINDAGRIVGTSLRETEDGEVISQAVLWLDDQTPVPLETLLTDPRWVLEQATAINARGQIAGVGLFNGEPRGFLLTPVLPPVRHPDATGRWHASRRPRLDTLRRRLLDCARPVSVSWRWTFST